MSDMNLEEYCARAIERGATHAKQIHPSTVITAAWVRLKCQFGCAAYNRGYCCPPYTPTPKQTREIIDCYDRAILFHREIPYKAEKRIGIRQYNDMLIDIEGEMFKNGYYKAIVFLSGPCSICKECTKIEEAPCKLRNRARPSMEACGIDVYQTARNNGFKIATLREITETANQYCLMLVD